MGRPIGIFDSGVGGLTVLREIRRLLPQADLHYVADSGHVPYGEKSTPYIIERSVKICEFLVAQGAQAIVVACNTATASAIQDLREAFSVPIVGMEPALKPAAAVTKSGVVGVLATTGTLASAKFAALLERYRSDVTVLAETCTGWVEAVERGEHEDPKTISLIEPPVTRLLEGGADALVLGCTHFPFLRPLIASIVGSRAVLIDTGLAVARRLHSRLPAAILPTSLDMLGAEKFWTSGDLEASTPVLRKLWRPNAIVKLLPHLYR